jgi:hypothetical protein
MVGIIEHIDSQIPRMRLNPITLTTYGSRTSSWDDAHSWDNRGHNISYENIDVVLQRGTKYNPSTFTEFMMNTHDNKYIIYVENPNRTPHLHFSKF